MLKLYIDLVYWPLKVLGPGNRLGIWFQGCSIRCSGCISPNRWEQDETHCLQASDISKMLQEFASRPVEGVTISGGEPFDQPEGLLFLLKELRVVYSVDILVYSGYEYEILTQKYPDILTYIDAIITGGFEEKQENHLALRGSDNQQLHLLTEVAKSRFHKTSQNWVESEQRIQLAVSEDKMALLGIPSRGEWQKIQKKLSMKGLQIENL